MNRRDFLATTTLAAAGLAAAQLPASAAAAPLLDAKGKRIKLTGEIPSALNPPSGCTFHTRCPVARPNCSTNVPALLPHGEDGRLAACHYAGEPL